MALLEIGDFNAYDFNTETFDPIPAGWYAAQIVDSSVALNKSATGKILKLTWEILDGEYKGRRIWENINYLHQTQKAQEIGQRQLAKITIAVDYGQTFTDTKVLHYLPCMIKVVIAEDKTGQYQPRNEVKDYRRFENVPQAASPAFSPALRSPLQPQPSQKRGSMKDQAMDEVPW